MSDNHDMGSCYFCETPCDSDNWCYGCGIHVCEPCDTNPEVGGSHEPKDHQQ